MAKHTEYRALMFREGKWQAFAPRFANKDDCRKWIQETAKNYKECGIPLPEKWQIQYRKVTTTDWIKYC